MDTQGTDDHSANMKDVTAIFGIANMVSSILVFNLPQVKLHVKPPLAHKTRKNTAEN